MINCTVGNRAKYMKLYYTNTKDLINIFVCHVIDFTY